MTLTLMRISIRFREIAHLPIFSPSVDTNCFIEQFWVKGGVGVGRL